MTSDLFSQPPLVRDTSRAAYKDLHAEGTAGDQQRSILEFLYKNKRPDGYTRAELASSLGLRISSVCGRVNELIKASKLRDDPKRKCSISGRSAHILVVP